MFRNFHLVKEQPGAKRWRHEHGDALASTAPVSTVHFSLRALACITFILLLSSQMLLISVWKSGHTKRLTMQQNMADALVTHWRVRPDKASNAKVRLRATDTAEAVGFLSPGTLVRAYQYDEVGSETYLFLMSPLTGFARTKLFEPIPDEDEFDLSPLMYEGYRMEGRNRTARYLYAPTILVVAQQLWNALQVFEIFLAMALYFVVRSNTTTTTESAKGCWATFARACDHRFWGLSGAVGLGILLPLSTYVSSPGATVYAFVTLMTCLVALTNNGAHVLVEVSPEESKIKDADTRWLFPAASSASSSLQQLPFLIPSLALDNGSCGEGPMTRKPEKQEGWQRLPVWLVAQEEMLGFLCNLASSLYNYHNSQKTWPHWQRHFFNLDKYFGWVGGDGHSKGDVFYTGMYALGLPNVDVPLYVPGSRGSTTGGHVFWMLWSIIPVLYVAYYLCMYLLAPRSPGVKIQRTLLLFAMFHFLFMTGKTYQVW